VKVRAAAGRLQTLPPIVLRFQTDTPIYPLRISAISPGVVDIRVYCFRERIARIAGYEDRGAYALREDFRRLCPALSEEVADVPWHKLQISRITDTLVAQVMRRLDDRIHDQQPQGPQAFYPFVNLARTVGIAEALTASDAAVANWAEENLPYYMYAKPRPGELPDEHLAALRETGKRQGYPLRDRLLAYIGGHVAAAKRRAAGFGRPDWSGDLMAAQNATGLEGAVILLVRTCEPGDRQVRDLLEEVVRVVGSGNYWGTALRELDRK
jgi:hypothetical protein